MPRSMNYPWAEIFAEAAMLALSIFGAMCAMGICFLVFAYRGFARAQEEIRDRERAAWVRPAREKATEPNRKSAQFTIAGDVIHHF